MHGTNLFAECMVDGDVTHRMEVRRERSKAVIVSMAFEIALLAILCLWPLYHLQAISGIHFVTPVLPFRPPTPPVVVQPAHLAPNSHSVMLAHPLLTLAQRPIQITQPRAISSGGDPEINTAFVSFDDVLPAGISVTPVGPPPPANTGPAKPIVKGGEVMAAMLTHRVEPTYPKIVEIMRLSGHVTLLAVIRTDGFIAELTVLDGNPILAAAAREAVAQWRYRPTFLNGQPVEVQTTITVNFTVQ